jgi:adenylosuccinate synthase
MLNIDRQRIIVDPRAVIVTEEDREAERRELNGIASTCSGTGAASVRRMSRRPEAEKRSAISLSLMGCQLQAKDRLQSSRAGTQT